MKEYVDQDSSHAAKGFILCFVITSLIMCGGTVFGFTPLKQVFLEEGIFEELCPTTKELPCDEQLEELDTMFTLAASLFSVWLLPAGFCLKFLGPRTCFLVGFTLIFIGSMVFATAPTPYYITAYVLTGTGNPLLYISAFNFAKLYPKSTNLLLSIFIGSFGFSSFVFYVFNEIFTFDNISSQELFLVYSALPIILGVIGLVILSPDPYHVQYQKKLQAKLDEEKVIATETTPLTNARVYDDTTEEETAPRELPLEEQTIPQQLASAAFLAQTIFFCWGMLHQNFYLGTLGDQVFMFAGSNPRSQEMAGEILIQFAWVYPIGCILSVLPVGALVRNTSVSTSLFAYCSANLLFSALALVPNVKVQWITSTIYILVRVGFFSVMSTYSATLFGFENLSSMFGCAGCVAGLCSLLGQILTHRALYVDHSFAPINSLLLAGAVLNFTFPLLLRKYWQ